MTPTTDSGEMIPAARPQNNVGGSQPPPEPEQHVACPRCESKDTKFCYYNNYNLSQPRHFCKSCRRYWTRGGTLRNIPVGGGSRKNPNSKKRLRTGATSSSSSSSTSPPLPLPSEPVPVIQEFKPDTVPFYEDMDLNLNEIGSGSGLEFGFGFGFGARVWQGGNTWQMGGGEMGGEGECFGWPDLAISTPGWGPK